MTDDYSFGDGLLRVNSRDTFPRLKRLDLQDVHADYVELFLLRAKDFFIPFVDPSNQKQITATQVKKTDRRRE